MDDLVNLAELSRFYVCRWCEFTFCEKFLLLPREVIDDECPVCEDTCDTWHIVVKDGRDCCVHYCDNCKNQLCYCSIESLMRVCPWFSVFDRWIILPLGA